VDLGFDDNNGTALFFKKLFGSLFRLFRRVGNDSFRDGNSEFSQDILALIFMNVRIDSGLGLLTAFCALQGGMNRSLRINCQYSEINAYGEILDALRGTFVVPLLLRRALVNWWGGELFPCRHNA